MADINVNLMELIAKVASVLPAAAGSLVSMKFMPPTLTRGQRFSSAMAAYAIGTYVGRGLCEQLHVVAPRAIDAIVFGIALLGMSFIGAVIEEVKPVTRMLIRKYTGVSDEGESK